MLRHNFEQYPGQENDYLLYYTYEAKTIKTKGEYFIDLSPIVSTNISQKSITYSYLDNVPNKKNCNQAKKFLKSLTKNYGFIQNKPLTYYVSNRKNAYKFFGFNYLLLSTGVFSKSTGTIINTTNRENDLHELTHYYFQDFALGKFLSEGIAVYYGGSNGVSLELCLVNEANSFARLDESEKTNWKEDFLSGVYKGGPYQPFFYALSGKLISDYLDKHTELELLQLFRSQAEITPREFITNELSFENEFTYLQMCLVQE